MNKRSRNWIIGIAVVLALTVVGLFIAASIFARRIEPMVREQAVRYLSDRFDSDVAIGSLRIHTPNLSIPKLLWNRGSGTFAGVEGDNVSLKLRGAGDAPPIFTMRKFSFSVDLGMLSKETKTVDVVSIEGLQINVPPKGERPKTPHGSGPKVSIGRVDVKDALLTLIPMDKAKTPLEFHIAKLELRSAGTDVPMKYDATLTIPKPPGGVQAKGSFGPWDAEEPGDTPLDGDYTFQNADLGVFKGIAGKLHSTGHFDGELSSLHVVGEASVPDFVLKNAGNAIPLQTRFDAQVDGTNGDTVLQPVRARLGSTEFTTSGAILKHEDLGQRSIELNVTMPNGQLRDVLRLAMKGVPFMEGRVSLRTKIDIPPLTGKVKEKLRLDGRFEVKDGKFLRSNIQDQVDQLSRRGQGQPNNQEIDEVISVMRGSFLLDDQVLHFRSLTFGVPGADIALAGNVDLGQDQLDLHGALKLTAKVSQTMSGWKRWVLKPVDPFFAKNGAGTFLRIKVDGTSKKPNFGLDRK